MSPDREICQDKSASLEEFKKQFQEYFEGVEYGSAKYQAFFDDQIVSGLERDLDARYEYFETRRSRYATRRAESMMRIVEIRLALFQAEVDKKKVSIRGYSEAYDNIHLGRAYFEGQARLAGKKLFGNNKERVEEYVSDEMDSLLSPVDLKLMEVEYIPPESVRREDVR